MHLLRRREGYPPTTFVCVCVYVCVSVSMSRIEPHCTFCVGGRETNQPNPPPPPPSLTLVVASTWVVLKNTVFGGAHRTRRCSACSMHRWRRISVGGVERAADVILRLAQWSRGGRARVNHREGTPRGGCTSREAFALLPIQSCACSSTTKLCLHGQD